jgi:hypothetical protein
MFNIVIYFLGALSCFYVGICHIKDATVFVPCISCAALMLRVVTQEINKK